MAKANIHWNKNGLDYIETHERQAIEAGERGDCRVGSLHVDHDNNVWCAMEAGPRLVGNLVEVDEPAHAPDARDASDPPSWEDDDAETEAK